MMTREEVTEIMTYCKEHGMSYKARLEELNLPLWRFYDSKARYAAEQEAAEPATGEFIELPRSGTFVPAPSFAGRSRRRRRNGSESGMMSVEIRTNAGTAIRIQGGLTDKDLCSIIKACSNVLP
ncbi:MAG: hypothetical protein LUC24_00105 [Bacteroidales bacterium]|nr:hypothetical protein [Bacteroidales bacterium]